MLSHQPSQCHVRSKLGSKETQLLKRNFRELKQQKVTDDWDDAVEIYKLSVGLQFNVSEISRIRLRAKFSCFFS